MRSVRYLIAAAIILALWVTPAQAAYSLLTHTISGTNSGGTTTGAIDTSGADLLVIGVSELQGAPGTVSDSKSNTWHALTARNGASTNLRTRIYYAWNATVGTGHTFTVSGGSCFCSLSVSAWSGSKTSADPFDVENGSASATTGDTVTSIQPGSVTPSENNELLISILDTDSGTSSWAINSSFTISDTIAYSGGAYYMNGMAYKIQTSAAAVNPAWSWTTSQIANTAIASFKAAPATVGPRHKISQ